MKPVTCYIGVEAPLDVKTFHFLLPFSPPEKQQRILRQRIKQNADAMVIGGALARYLLWEQFSVPLNAEICLGKFGKPYLPDYPHCYFNISHSGQYVVCAVCDTPVGTDIQQIIPYRLEIAEKVFETEKLHQIECSSDPAAEFTKAWTQMEAMAKAQGTGIANKQQNDVLYHYETLSYPFEDAFLSISYMVYTLNP